MIGFLCSGTILPRTKITISAGTSVIDSSAAAAIAKVLVKASGLNSRPSCDSSVKIGMNDTVMISRLKNSAGPTSRGRLDQDVDPGLSGLRPFEVLVGVLDHDDRRVHHGADRDRDAAEAHDVGAEAQQLHGAERHQHADRQHQDRHQRAANVQQEHDADQRDDDAFLEQRVLERVDGRVDQVRAVVDRHDLDRFRQAAGDLLEALLDVLDDVERVDAEALQHDAARDLAFAVQFGDAAPLVGTEFDPRDVAQQDRRAVADLQDDVAEVVDALQIALAADDVFEFGEFDGAAADIGIAGADRVAHLLHGDAEVAHALRIEDHVVLPDEAADARDFRDAFGLGERELQIPVLDRARVGEVQLLRHDRVLVDPADAGRVRADGRRHAGRQCATWRR